MKDGVEVQHNFWIICVMAGDYWYITIRLKGELIPFYSISFIPFQSIRFHDGDTLLSRNHIVTDILLMELPEKLYSLNFIILFNLLDMF